MSATRRRVVYVSRLPPPGGGIATWTRILFERGLADGWNTRLVDTRLPAARRAFEGPRLGPAEAWRTLRILGSLLRELRARPDVVHVNVGSFELGLVRDLVGLGLARAFSVPVVLHYHGHLPVLEGRRCFQWVLGRAARRASLNLVLSRPSRAFLSDLAPDAPVATLPNFYDETAPAGRPQSEPRRGAPRVAFAGALVPAKGIGEALAVAAALPDVELALLGAIGDEAAPGLRDAPANVRVYGELDAGGVQATLADAHLLLFPSRVEGFPYAVLEAMALGLPVVATRVGAVPEMIEQGRGGILCDPDPEQLARAVQTLLDDEPRRLAMGRYNRDKCRREYAYDVVGPRLVSLYERLVLASDAEPDRA